MNQIALNFDPPRLPARDLAGARRAGDRAIAQGADKAQIWRSIPGYEGAYDASDCGSIRSLDRVVPHAYVGSQTCQGKLLKQGVSNSGYRYIVLYRARRGTQSAFVHRLVLMAFDPRENSDALQVNHLDGDKNNNRLSNLAWVTPSENRIHSMIVLGNMPPTSLSGSASQNAKPIERVSGDGVTTRYGSAFDATTEGFSASCISDCCRGKQKTHRGYSWRYAAVQ